MTPPQYVYSYNNSYIDVEKEQEFRKTKMTIKDMKVKIRIMEQDLEKQEREYIRVKKLENIKRGICSCCYYNCLTKDEIEYNYAYCEECLENDSCLAYNSRVEI